MSDEQDGFFEPDMTTDLASFRATNPVFTASGCAAAGRELNQFFDVAELGGVVTKSVMLRPRSGRPTPRMAETPSGMLNSIGLQGPGIDAFCDHDLPWLVDHGAKAVVSIAGGHVEDYRMLAQRLADEPGVAMVEVNISCPNVEDRGQVFACDPWEASRVVRAVRGELAGRIPLFAKLSPDVTDIVEIAKACVDAGADGLSMINTLLGLEIDTETMRPKLAGVTGGVSGPAIRPVALRCVWQVHQALPYIPILGMGGIMTGEDALAFILAGASAVSVGTAVFHDPSAPIRVLGELRDLLAERGFSKVSDAIGYAHRPAEPRAVPVPVEVAESPADEALDDETLDDETLDDEVLDDVALSAEASSEQQPLDSEALDAALDDDEFDENAVDDEALLRSRPLGDMALDDDETADDDPSEAATTDADASAEGAAAAARDLADEMADTDAMADAGLGDVETSEATGGDRDDNVTAAHRTAARDGADNGKPAGQNGAVGQRAGSVPHTASDDGDGRTETGARAARQR